MEQIKSGRRKLAANDQDTERSRIRNALAPVFAVLVTCYFTYHIFQGDRGVISWFRLQSALEQDEIRLKTLRREREILERQVYLLRPESLDIDMLEERARCLLNYARNDEIVIYGS